MARVNDQEKYDPDFGKGFYPDCDSVYLIEVSPPKDKKIKKWKFYILLPRISDDEEEKAVLQYAAERLLEGGENVKIYAVEAEEWEGFSKSTPIAMFDPESLRDFFWLTPPKYLMN